MPVYYRGDGRPPATIFTFGFVSQDELNPVVPLGLHPVKRSNYFAEPKIGIYCSMDWMAAAYFPDPRDGRLHSSCYTSYIYCILSDDEPHDTVDFHSDSLMDTVSGLNKYPEGSIENQRLTTEFIQLEWVKEVKLRKVEPKAILFALELKRQRNGFKGGITSFMIQSFQLNPGFESHHPDFEGSLIRKFSNQSHIGKNIKIPRFPRKRKELLGVLKQFQQRIKQEDITDPAMIRMVYEATLSKLKALLQKNNPWK